MKRVNALVLTGYGLNCDDETAYAFELAGATAQRVHINALIDGSISLDDFQIIAFIGGFSWADDHGAGVLEAVRLKSRVGDRLLHFATQDKLMIGICNGFQCLANIGLLPALDGDYTRRSVAVTYNDCGNFQNVWVHLAVNANSPCVFTRGQSLLEFPVRHGEGKFLTDAQTLTRLERSHQIVMRYALPNGQPAKGDFPYNPNGSMDDVAGICDATGRIFGLMPHPEGYNHWTSHPDWSLLKERVKRGLTDPPSRITPGVQLFKNAVDYLS